MPGTVSAETIKKLKAELKEKDEIIRQLESVSEAYERLSEVYNQQLREADRTLKAQETVQEMLIREKADAEATIRAHEEILELNRSEKLDTERLLEAQIEVGRLSIDEMRERDRALQRILQVNREISSILDLNTLLRNTLQRLLESVSADRGVLYLENNHSIQPRILSGIRMEEWESEALKTAREAVMMAGFDKKSTLSKRSGTPGHARSYMAVPLLYQEHLLGVLYADITRDNASFKDHDLQLAEIFSSQAAVSMVNARMYQELADLNRGLEAKVASRTAELEEAYTKLNAAFTDLNRKEQMLRSDLTLASRIQNRLLSGSRVPQLPDCDIFYEPLLTVGGDTYDIFRMEDGRVRLFLADATGHGVPAALVTMLIQGEYNKLKSHSENPADILRALNDAFIKTYYSLSVFFTCILMDIDLENKTIHYASAGHPAQFLLTAKGLKSLPPGGKMIGVADNATFVENSTRYAAGDMLVLFTDGAFEEFNPAGKELGETGWARLVREAWKSKPALKDLNSLLVSGIRNFINGAETNDDITLMTFRLP